MNPIEALRFFRKNKNIPQTHMLPTRSDKSYSRLESGQSKLTYQDLLASLNTLELSLKEFFHLIDLEDNIPIMAIDKQYRKCVSMVNNEQEKAKLLKQFQLLDENQNKNAMEMAIYNDIKLVFHAHWSEIPCINDADIEHILALIQKKDYYTYYDYRMVVNPIIFFQTHQIEKVLNLMYPVAEREQRSFSTLSVANMIYPNIITKYLYKQDLHTASHYLEIAKKISVDKDEFPYHFQLRYLENLTKYLLTRNIKFYTEVLRIIELLGDFGHEELAKSMLKEADQLISGDTYNIKEESFPINVSFMSI
jgi:transcriptional regulator with XRE-family HTH domain